MQSKADHIEIRLRSVVQVWNDFQYSSVYYNHKLTYQSNVRSDKRWDHKHWVGRTARSFEADQEEGESILWITENLGQIWKQISFVGPIQRGWHRVRLRQKDKTWMENASLDPCIRWVGGQTCRVWSQDQEDESIYRLRCRWAPPDYALPFWLTPRDVRWMKLTLAIQMS